MTGPPKVDLKYLQETGKIRFIGHPGLSAAEGAITAHVDTVDKVQLPDGSWAMSPDPSDRKTKSKKVP